MQREGQLRRELALVVLATAAAGVLCLWAVSRTWWVDVVVRPDPLPVERVASRGWSGLTACAVVALAGAGALLATRRWERRLVGLVLVGSGLALAIGGLWALLSGANVIGPLLAATGGLVVVGCGGLVATRGSDWPTMGSRYERFSPKKDDLWGALDQGEDPTLR